MPDQCDYELKESLEITEQLLNKKNEEKKKLKRELSSNIINYRVTTLVKMFC